MDDYTNKQLKAYDEALDTWSTYEQRSEPIWARGKATPAAQALFEQYFLDGAAQLSRLRVFEQADVRTLGLVKVFWSKARSISNPKAAARRGLKVVIEQCVDYRTRTVTAGGKPSPLAPKFRKPLSRLVTMTRLGGSTWLIASVDDLSDGKANRCSPTS